MGDERTEPRFCGGELGITFLGLFERTERFGDRLLPFVVGKGEEVVGGEAELCDQVFAVVGQLGKDVERACVGLFACEVEGEVDAVAEAWRESEAHAGGDVFSDGKALEHLCAIELIGYGEVG